MTDQELAQIEERCARATKGPWHTYRKLYVHESRNACIVKTDYIPNSIFIAHARTDLPRCVEEIKRLREEVRLESLSHGETKRWYCVVIAERDKANARAERAEARVKELEKELEGYKAFQRSANEALNMGDGSYRP
jgi:hypothetical protein